MAEHKIKRALISVYDKTGIVDFARALVDEFGIEIISTGGTASLLKKSGVPVTLVEEVTGFPEMMDGRVKTLHPKIHAGILADRDNPEHMRQLEEQGIKPIDMVVVNLYPFEKTVADPNCTFEQAIEMIDIGGPCLLRAAAKNHKHVIPVPCHTSYDSTLLGMRQSSRGPYDARETFWFTACYDTRVCEWLSQPKYSSCGIEYYRFFRLLSFGETRYGENPHQSAREYMNVDLELTGPGIFDDNSSIEMSFNNHVDADAAFRLCRELTLGLFQEEGGDSAPCISAFVKHTNACGVGVAEDKVEAYRRAYLGDPSAAMGGVLECNFDIDADFARAVMETYARWGKDAGAGGFFLEVWIAPDFTEEAVNIIRIAKKWGERVRILSCDGDVRKPVNPQAWEVKSLTSEVLFQSPNLVGLNEDQWNVVTKRKPAESEMDDLRLAWLVCKHTKSNAITICKDNMLIGNGAGQMSRVMSCRIATWLAKENGHQDKLKGSVAASDAFFPFSDGPTILIDAGVTAIIQPGGSKRDEDTIAACDERDVAMIFTGTRHFKH